MARTRTQNKREITVTTSEARQKWAELLEQVRFHGVTVKVRHYRKTVARIIAEPEEQSA